MTFEMESDSFLAPRNRTLLPGDAFFELSQQITDQIALRAFELFASRGFAHGHDREDWLQATSDILLHVPVNVTETETELTILADVPGFTEKELEVRVSPRSVCITGKRQEASEQKEEKTVYVERRSNQIFRAVPLQAEIDPYRVDATVSNGILEIKLSKVGLGKKVPVLAKAVSA